MASLLPKYNLIFSRISWLITSRHWKKAQEGHCCKADFCPCWPVNQLNNNKKNGHTCALFHCSITCDSKPTFTDSDTYLIPGNRRRPRIRLLRRSPPKGKEKERGRRVDEIRSSPRPQRRLRVWQMATHVARVRKKVPEKGEMMARVKLEVSRFPENKNC